MDDDDDSEKEEEKEGQVDSSNPSSVGGSGSGSGSGTTSDGIIPRLIEDLFKTMEAAPPSSEFTVRVSFVEIYCEKILDLLAEVRRSGSSSSSSSSSKRTRCMSY